MFGLGTYFEEAFFRQNVKGISEKITIYNAGVWKENGMLSYGKMASSDSFSIFNPRETVTADTVRLDDVLWDRRITLLKIDIEGAEKAALEGAEKLIKSQSLQSAYTTGLKTFGKFPSC